MTKLFDEKSGWKFTEIPLIERSKKQSKDIEKKETLIVNVIGGPCSGKSTVTAELFARLKKMGIKCELCPEYIKDRIYEENKTMIVNQIALFGMEVYGLEVKLNKVDVIIHDGSLINNIVYDRSNNKDLHEFILKQYKKYNNLDFFLNRGTLEFEDYGRIHNLDESKEIDNILKTIYKENDFNLIEVESRDAVDKMIPIILHKLGN